MHRQDGGEDAVDGQSERGVCSGGGVSLESGGGAEGMASRPDRSALSLEGTDAEESYGGGSEHGAEESSPEHGGSCEALDSPVDMRRDLEGDGHGDGLRCHGEADRLRRAEQTGEEHAEADAGDACHELGDDERQEVPSDVAQLEIERHAERHDDGLDPERDGGARLLVGRIGDTGGREEENESDDTQQRGVAEDESGASLEKFGSEKERDGQQDEEDGV